MILKNLKQIATDWINAKVRYQPNPDIAKKTVLITGATGGLGKYITRILSEKGMKVVAIARDLSQLEELKHQYPHILTVAADVTNPQDVHKIFTSTMAWSGTVDVLINNVGIFRGGPLEQASVKQFDDLITTNMKTCFLMSQGVIPIMKKHKSGLILNIGSKISHNTQVGPHKVLYAMTKYGVEGFSYALNRELKPFGVRVSCIMPGTMNSYLSKESFQLLNPIKLAELICIIIEHEDIDFESLVVKAKTHAL